MRVKELEDVGIIREVQISKEKNRHSKSEIRMYLDSDDAAAKLRKFVGTEVCIEDEQRIHMRGTISRVDCSTSFSGSHALIHVVSFSNKIDQSRNSRIFQDTKKKYKDVMDFFCRENSSIQITDHDFANCEEPSVLVQDGDTDFEFIRKIANRMGYDLYIIDTERNPRINICVHGDYAQKDLKEENVILCHFAKDAYSEIVNIISRDYLEIGQRTGYQGIQYIVTSVGIHYKDGVTKYQYRLEKRELVKSKVRFSGFLGEAKVTENKDPDQKGRLQVSFLDYEDPMENNRVWIPYLLNITEKEQGSLLIPGVDEIVSVFCKNGKCYSDGCVRAVAYDDKLGNPEERIVMFGDKYVVVKEDSIAFEAFDNKITIDKDFMIYTKEDSHFKVEKDKMYLQIGESKVKVDDKSIQLQSSDRIDLKSDKINMDGSGKIIAKTSAFDVG